MTDEELTDEEEFYERDRDARSFYLIGFLERALREANWSYTYSNWKGGKFGHFVTLQEHAMNSSFDASGPTQQQALLKAINMSGCCLRDLGFYNPEFGDNRECECGHPYHRHFDSYDDMSPVGCKYCGDCVKFSEKVQL